MKFKSELDRNGTHYRMLYNFVLSSAGSDAGPEDLKSMIFVAESAGLEESTINLLLRKYPQISAYKRRTDNGENPIIALVFPYQTNEEKSLCLGVLNFLDEKMGTSEIPYHVSECTMSADQHEWLYVYHMDKVFFGDKMAITFALGERLHVPSKNMDIIKLELGENPDNNPLLKGNIAATIAVSNTDATQLTNAGWKSKKLTEVLSKSSVGYDRFQRFS